MKIAPHAITLPRIIRVAEAFQELRDATVFLGGAIIELLVTDVAAYHPRSTKDVDLVVEISHHSDQRLILRLRELGFHEDLSEDAPRCRYILDRSVVVDIIDLGPNSSAVNRWYARAFKDGCIVQPMSCPPIKLIRSPHFIATKIEAFKNRGKGDPTSSHDIEDIVAICDGRRELLDEIRASDDAIRQYLAQEFQGFLRDITFMESLPAQFSGDAASQARIPRLIKLLERIAVNDSI